MQKTILQVPLNKTLKDEAEKAAYAQGFSSLQEVIRVFLAKLADRKIEVSLQDTIYLSERAEKRYMSLTEDFEKKKNITSVNNISELFEKLDESSLS